MAREREIRDVLFEESELPEELTGVVGEYDISPEEEVLKRALVYLEEVQPKRGIIIKIYTPDDLKIAPREYDPIVYTRLQTYGIDYSTKYCVKCGGVKGCFNVTLPSKRKNSFVKLCSAPEALDLVMPDLAQGEKIALIRLGDTVLFVDFPNPGYPRFNALTSGQGLNLYGTKVDPVTGRITYTPKLIPLPAGF